MNRVLWCAVLLFGCSKEEVPSLIEGTLSLPDYGERADVRWDKAFGYVEGSSMIAFITGAEGATCDSVAAYLGPKSGALPKDDILEGGSCTLFIRTQEWYGGWSASYPNSSDASYPPSIDSNIRCEFGDGEWVYEERGEGYVDYYWSGTVWQGIPDVFEWDLSGGRDGFEIDVNMSHYDGGFLHSDNHEEVLGSGDISGLINASWCGEFENATAL